jgi:hypothetical protein
MKIDKNEEMNQLEKVRNTTVKNLSIWLRKDMAFHHLDKSTEVIQWDFHQQTQDMKNFLKFLYEVQIVTLKK